MLYVVGEEMNVGKIIEKVEKIINGHEEAALIVDDAVTPVEKDLFNVTNRLIKAEQLYNSSECGASDYLSALRNFLIAFKTSLSISALDIPEQNRFGIYKDPVTGKYYATYDVPSFLIHPAFVKDAFVDLESNNPSYKTKYMLKTNKYISSLTGFTHFKSLEQKLSVYGGLKTPDGFTTLISMPTGGGKSLVTQTLAYEKTGLTIVVVPTVSLAIDQERVAKQNIINSDSGEIFCYYSGSNNIADISRAIEKKTARLLFISPEALIKNTQFQQLIGVANSRKYIKNIVIDEAHIVVAWGDFFRVDYQCLGPWRRELLKTTPEIRTFLLSATYRDETVSSLKRMFSDNEKWLEIRCDSLRKEPRFIFLEAKGYQDKKRKVVSLVDHLPHPMILYVNAPYQADKWKQILENEGYKNIRTFTGETKAAERDKLINEWSDNEYEIMIATSAFGVGVDKPDVRTVIHLYVPESPDSYYQELGRGGRDGLCCLSVMCVDQEDLSSASDHLGQVLTTPKLWGRWWSMFQNPVNPWHDGKISIMASTKPNYNKINFFEEGNETDEKWNINVLLLLNRYGLIDIVGLDLDQDNRYIFTIKILDKTILQENEQSLQLINDIREKEVNKSLRDFSLIIDSIKNNDRICWSSMFYETYPLVSEYCAGCNAHEQIERDEVSRFPLLESVSGPEKEISVAAMEFFSDTNEALIIIKSIEDVIIKYNPDIIVCDDEDINGTAYPLLNIMNFAEFRDLQARDNGFYISGLIIAVYSEDDVLAKRQYQIVYRALKNNKYVIHVSSRDFCISASSGKYLSDLVSGSVIK